MQISVVVMAHPKRWAAASRLGQQLKQYPFASVSMIWDEQNNEWHTGERAMRSGIGQGDWHLVIQDDAILTPDFYSNIEAALAAVPTKSIISLYTGKVKPLPDRVGQAVAAAPDGSWLQFYMMLWGVAILIPSDHIEPMLDFVDDPRYTTTQYDNKVGMFYQRNRLPMYYTMPSLVDHDDALGTLLPDHHTKTPRVAYRLATGRLEWSNAVRDI